VLTLLLLIQAASPGSGATVEGKGSPTAEIPRLESEVRIDGTLDEPVWSQATRLAGFWQYQPVDGRPAEEETEVLVWYAPDAIYFGIIAQDRSPAAIRATVADRDNIDKDDYVVLDLDTLSRPPPSLLLRGEPVGSSERRGSERGSRSGQQPHSGKYRCKPRFHLAVEGPDHRPRISGRDPYSVPKSPLSWKWFPGLGL